ncbi:MAG TPA: zeta toxin family protein, partial [Gemmatimonadaceae bacterium]
DRHPIHAAAISRNGRAVLLAGASGAGKSTLAHLADSAGDDVLGEDHVWIQLESTRRVWGWPGYARLLNGAADKSVSPLRGRDRVSCYVADAPTVCVLDRGPRAALERVDAPTILDALTCDVAPGFDRFPERNVAVANALSAGGGWRLTLTTNPNDALPLLDEMLNAS